MKKLLSFFTILSLALLMPVKAQAASLVKQITGPHFRAGESVVLTEDLVGDVYVGGATVMVEGKIDGDLIVGGGTVTLNGEVTEDIRVGGGNVVLNGTVGQDVTAGGGSITFGPASNVMGSVLAGGGMVVYNGDVMGDVWTGAGAVQMAGDFGQDVKVEADGIQVLSNTTVGGDLVANYGEESQVSEQAQISGETNINQVYRSYKAEEKMAKIDGYGKDMNNVGAVFSLILGLVSGLVLMYLFPKATDEMSANAMKNPLPSMGWGALKLFLGPLVIILLMVTVIGMPLAFLMLMGYIVSWMVACWISGKALGEKIYKESKAKWFKDRYLQFIIGLALIKLLSVLPVVGWLVKLTAFLIGFGAIARWFKGKMKPKKK